MLKKIFHLSEEGSKAVMKASLCMTIFNLATLLPIILLASVDNISDKMKFQLTRSRGA